VLGIVRSYLAEDRDIDPMAAYAERAADADRAAVEALARLRGLRRVVFKRVLAWGRSSAQTRENVKSEAVRWLVAIRLSLLAIGTKLAEAGVLDRADDIFFIEYDQLPALVGGDPRDWRSLVAGRRTEHERLEKLSPPPVVLGTWDESAGPWFTGEAAKTLTGISVSAGVARGPARVFLSADTDEPVLPGEILVAPFTDPGWTPYFVPAAGIVMDMGGLLSHGSIIAREYGIPAVVNVGPATQIIRTGQIIEVDGEKGEVRILG
jgi:phosphohistidine swiveling domain-containing protein